MASRDNAGFASWIVIRERTTTSFVTQDDCVSESDAMFEAE